MESTHIVKWYTGNKYENIMYGDFNSFNQCQEHEETFQGINFYTCK